jgi:PAS domain S-box-containing protein
MLIGVQQFASHRQARARQLDPNPLVAGLVQRRLSGRNAFQVFQETDMKGENKTRSQLISELGEAHTEHKQMEDTLCLQTTALQAAANAIVITDREGNIIWANPAFTRLTGYGLGEVLGQNPRLLKSGFQDDAFYRDLWETILSGQVWHGQMVNRRQDGTLYTEEMTITPVRQEGGEITHFIAVKQDVTEPKEVEAALRESEARFRAVADSAIDAIISADRQGNIVFCNASAQRMWGYSEDEMLGKPLPFLMPEEYRDAHRQAMQRLHATGEPRLIGKLVEIAGLRKDGSWFPLELSLATWETGGEVFYSAIMRDISERKRTEEALQANEARLAEAQRIAHLGNWEWDIVTNTLMWSDEIYLIFGLQPQAFGATYEAFLKSVHPDDREAVTQAVNATVEENEPYSIEHRVVRPDGTERVVHQQGVAYRDESGRPLRMLGTVHDITERKRAEEQTAISRRFVEAAGQGFGVGTFEGEIVYANAALCRILGVDKPEDVVGQSYLSLYPQEMRRQVETEILPTVQQEGQEWSGELALVSTRGTTVPTHQAFFAIRDAGGIPLYVAAVVSDITELKQAEKALHERAAELERSNTLIAALSRVAVRVQTTLDLEQTLQTLSSELYRLGISSLVALLDPEDQALVVRHVSTQPRVLASAEKLAGRLARGFRIQRGHLPMYDDLIERGRPQLVQHVLPLMGAMFPGIPRAARERFLRLAGMGLDDASINLPLSVENNVTGILAVWGGDLSEGDIPVLSVFAGQVASALRAAELYEQAQEEIGQRERTEEALRQHRDHLDELVQERTAELGKTVEQLLFEIDERKQTEDKLRESQRRLSHLMANLPGMAYRCRNDPDWTMEFVSQGSFDLTGYRSEELVGNQTIAYAELIHQDDRQPVWEQVQAAVQQGTPFRLVYRIETAGGEERWVWEQGSGVWSSQGELLALEGFITDVTERTKAEKALRESEERYRTLAEAAQDIIFIIGSDDRVRYVNSSGVQALGRSLDDVIGQPLKTLFPPNMAGDLSDSLRWVFRSGEPLTRESQIPFERGELWLNTVLVPLRDAAGATSAVMGIARDVTEHKQAEEALIQERASLARRVAERTAELSTANAELARAARLKDEFLANMSHELRTPLNAILGMSEALQEKVYGPLTDRQFRSLHTIEESGRHLLSLINDILDVSKIEADKLELEIGPVSVESVCHASLGLVKQGAHQKRLTVSSTLDSAVTMIQADERRLKQILVNLLSNAVKFTPDGGEIGLEVVGDAEGKVVHFTVWDSGIGIAEEDVGRLFQPFVQLDSSLSRQHAGTGLGLVLVRRLAEMHGGGVSLESEVGQGSRVTVSLPWRAGSDLTPARAMERAREAVRRTVRGLPRLQRAVVVEDSTVAASQIARYLAELGVEAIVHPQGLGAVERVLEVDPDVIILDLLLPDLPGWDVLRKLKAEPRTRDIPVLLASVVDDRSRGLAQGAAAYLVKPISRRQLQQALQQILAGEAEKPKALVVSGEPAPPDKRPLILLAEDNEGNVDTISDYLLDKGYRVAVARSGLEAIEQAREERPDLILMDIQMPGMDGLEATRRIRADADAETGLSTGLAQVPIIALTALAMPGDRERCLEAGANDYLSKPVSLRGLVRAIEAQLHQDGEEEDST